MAGSALSESFSTRMKTANQFSSVAELLIGGQVDEVAAVLAVGRVEQARDLDLVLQVADVDVDALGVAVEGDLLLVAARAEGDGGEGDEHERDEAAGHERGRILSPTGETATR